MNFIIRNLGWILLIIFFVFMLYLISNQNNTKDLSLETGTGMITKQSDLVEEIKPEEKQEEKEEIIMVEEVKEDMKNEIVELSKEKNINTKGTSYINELASKIDVVSGETKVATLDGSTGGIMSSIRNFFTIKKIETLTGTTLLSTGGVDKGLIAEVETELSKLEKEVIIKDVEKEVVEEVKEEKKKSILDFSFGKKKEVNTGIVGELNDILGLDSTKKKEKRNIEEIKVETKKEEVKEISKAKIVKVEKKKNKEINESKEALATYEIGVKSMFLNNAWFTKRTGVLYKGDKVEQLTATNKYGCFQVKVLSSSNTANNGKIAWACKYYMTGHQASLSSYTSAAKVYYRSINKKVSKSVVKKSVVKYMNNSAKTNSKVGTIHSVKTHSLKLNNKSFTKINAYLLEGDKVEQLTNINSSGCFKASVYSSNNTAGNTQGKSGWVCKKYLK